MKALMSDRVKQMLKDPQAREELRMALLEHTGTPQRQVSRTVEFKQKKLTVEWVSPKNKDW